MSTNPSLSIVIQHLQPDCLNDDTAVMLSRAWKNSGISMQLMQTLLRLNKELQTTSNPELNNKIKILKADMVNFFKKQLETANSPLDYLVFEITELAKLELHEAKQGILRDIDYSDLISDNIKFRLETAIKSGEFSSIPSILKDIPK